VQAFGRSARAQEGIERCEVPRLGALERGVRKSQLFRSRHQSTRAAAKPWPPHVHPPHCRKTLEVQSVWLSLAGTRVPARVWLLLPNYEFGRPAPPKWQRSLRQRIGQ